MIEVGFNIYALSGGAFLFWFAFLAVGCIAILLPVTTAIFHHRASRELGLNSQPRDSFQTAMVVGGRQRAVLTAVAWLVDRGYARISGSRLVIENQPPADSHPLVRDIAEQADRGVPARQLMKGRATPESLARLRTELEAAQLVLPASNKPWWVLAAVMILPPAIALPRILAAEDAGRPYGFVVLLTIFAVLLGTALFVGLIGAQSSRTEGGRRVVEAADRARRTPTHELDDGAVTAAALFGAGALASTDIGDLSTFATTHTRPLAAGGCGAFGGGGDAGGDAGGGGGGCGGGGCGGGGCGG